MEKWSQKQSELAVPEPKPQPNAPVAALPAESHSAVTPESGVVETSAAPAVVTDPLLEGMEIAVGNVCLLCKRQFASEEILKKHQQLSDLHKVLVSKCSHNFGTAQPRNGQVEAIAKNERQCSCQD